MLQIINLHLQIMSNAVTNDTFDPDLHWMDIELQINRNSVSVRNDGLQTVIISKN